MGHPTSDMPLLQLFFRPLPVEKTVTVKTSDPLAVCADGASRDPIGAPDAFDLCSQRSVMGGKGVVIHAHLYASRMSPDFCAEPSMHYPDSRSPTGR